MKANEEYGKFTGPAEVRIVRTLPGPIERVWEYLTDPEKRSRWFAGGPMELKAGGKMTLHFQHKKLAPNEVPPEQYQQTHEGGRVMEGTVTRCEPPRLLAFTFGSSGDSVVTFELTPQGETVQLVVTHRSQGEDLEYMADFGSGWHSHLAFLLAILEGQPPPGFWGPHALRRGEYEKLRLAAQAP